jgi:hypothetical protein
MRKLLETEQKALEINLDPLIYGTFAEIGAGQEVARYFFQVGAAAGTIAKTMSAYDKVYSDHIYGPEPSGRYVCESRLYKMLDHEYELMNTRLRQERPECSFFVFADTISAINYQKTIKGDGWLGIRFQLSPEGEMIWFCTYGCWTTTISSNSKPLVSWVSICCTPATATIKIRRFCWSP